MEFIYNPTATKDHAGHLPQIRRSSLSEEEEQRMEMEAVNHVVFKDSNVANMNMNIVNNHNHSHSHSHSHSHAHAPSTLEQKSTRIDELEKENARLLDMIEAMETDKVKLARNASVEMDHLRNIIRRYSIR